MPTGDVLTPTEAAHIATNSYFTLKDWVLKEPSAGVEERRVIQDRVLGDASIGKRNPDTGAQVHADSSLKGTGLQGAKLGNVHSGKTGFGTTSGFGYTLTYEGGGRKHAVIATRGTRPEMDGIPDIITDLRGTLANMGGYGPVHRGFKKTYDSVMPHLSRDRGLIDDAQVVHCVGHSLGGGVATLIAAHYAAAGKNVKLYTFGCPRVGCFNTYSSFEKKIGTENIYRVSHDLDPITMIGPYPYVHVQPTPSSPGNMTLPSPTGNLINLVNHDMLEYTSSVRFQNWAQVRNGSKFVDHANSVLARSLLHGDSDPGWVTYASVQTLSLLFKLLDHVLKSISTALILGLTPIDLLAEILMKGLNKGRELGAKLLSILGYAAKWAGIQVANAADMSAAIIKAILSKMLGTLKAISISALTAITRNITPVQIGIAGSILLTSCSAL